MRRALNWSRIWDWLSRHKWQLLLLFAMVVIPLFAFGSLAEDVVEKEHFFFDEPILRFIHGQSTPLLDQIMLFFSLIGFWYGLVPVDILGFVLLVRQRKWTDVLFWSLSIGGAGIINLLAKPFFNRLRPDLWIPLAPETSLSFPSGHAMGSMALVAALVVLCWPTRFRWWSIIVGGIFVVMVGTSRAYLGVHYPSDILAGWTASLAWVAGLAFIFERHRKKSERHIDAQVA